MFWMTYLSYVFLLDASLFSPQLMKRKRNKNQLIKYFWTMLLRKKNLEIHKHSWLSMVWIFKKLDSSKSNYLINYLQSTTTFWAKLLKNPIQQLKLLLPWANLCFILTTDLPLLRIELSRVNCSCSHFFSPAS